MSAGIYRGPERFVPKLIFASASGRTEISTRPGGAIRIDLVAERKDEIAPDEVARLIARLTAWQAESAVVTSLSPDLCPPPEEETPQ